jgi:hypothetical protein
MNFKASYGDTLLEGRELGYNQRVLGERKVMLIGFTNMYEF